MVRKAKSRQTPKRKRRRALKDVLLGSVALEDVGVWDDYLATTPMTMGWKLSFLKQHIRLIGPHGLDLTKRYSRIELWKSPLWVFDPEGHHYLDVYFVEAGEPIRFRFRLALKDLTNCFFQAESIDHEHGSFFDIGFPVPDAIGRALVELVRSGGVRKG